MNINANLGFTVCSNMPQHLNLPVLHGPLKDFLKTPRLKGVLLFIDPKEIANPYCFLSDSGLLHAKVKATMTISIFYAQFWVCPSVVASCALPPFTSVREVDLSSEMRVSQIETYQAREAHPGLESNLPNSKQTSMTLSPSMCTCWMSPVGSHVLKKMDKHPFNPLRHPQNRSSLLLWTEAFWSLIQF